MIYIPVISKFIKVIHGINFTFVFRQKSFVKMLLPVFVYIMKISCKIL